MNTRCLFGLSRQFALLLLTAAVFSLLASSGGITTRERRRHVRDEVKAMFIHAYDSYMKNAFPSDELKPISCTGGDTLGGYMLTLVDALDTLVVMGNYSEFAKQVIHLGQTLDFNRDVNVSVFETNIRIVGGLLSAHLLITETDIEGLNEFRQVYNGSMLRLTIDMADRLLKAFDTPTGLPYGTVNLKYGVPEKETPVVCTACAGTYALEFGVLSRLTGDPKYEEAARKAVRALFSRRSTLGLVGNHINSTDGVWTLRDSGIGASIDSYFEYLLKGAILFDDDEYLDYFDVFYNAAEKHLRREDWYMQADMLTGQITWALMSTLQAFWPGVQTLYGDYRPAARTMRSFQMIWRNLGFTPEGFGLVSARVEPGQARYPLRPEMAESLWYLSQYSGDDTWWEYGIDIIHSIQNYTRTSCGYAVVEDVESKALGDQMESFFLAETLKYLYLLFDDDNFINQGDYVFNTEGHPIPIKYKFSYPNKNNGPYQAWKQSQGIVITPRTTTPDQTYLQKLSTGSVPLWLLAQSARQREEQQKKLQQQQQQTSEKGQSGTADASAQNVVVHLSTQDLQGNQQQDSEQQKSLQEAIMKEIQNLIQKGSLQLGTLDDDDDDDDDEDDVDDFEGDDEDDSESEANSENETDDSDFWDQDFLDENQSEEIAASTEAEQEREDSDESLNDNAEEVITISEEKESVESDFDPKDEL